MKNKLHKVVFSFENAEVHFFAIQKRNNTSICNWKIVYRNGKIVTGAGKGRQIINETTCLRFIKQFNSI